MGFSVLSNSDILFEVLKFRFKILRQNLEPENFSNQHNFFTCSYTFLPV